MDGSLVILGQVRDAVRAVFPAALSDLELVDGLAAAHALQQQTAALHLALLREIVVRGVPAAQGARADVWLADKEQVTVTAARRILRLAQALDTTATATGQALADGQVNLDQATVITQAVRRLPAHHRAEGEAFLLAKTKELDAGLLRHAGDRIHEVVDPAGADKRAQQLLARRTAHWEGRRGLTISELDGSDLAQIRVYLTAEELATLRAAIDPLSAPRPRRRTLPRQSTQIPQPAHPLQSTLISQPAPADDRTSGVALDGVAVDGDGLDGADVPHQADSSRSEPTHKPESQEEPADDNNPIRVGEDDDEPILDLRTTAARRLDALIEVCRYTLAGGRLPDHGGDRPHVLVTTTLETLHDQIGTATLQDGSPIGPADARRLACDCKVIPAVLGTASEVLDLGRTARLVPATLRRALVARDRGCVFPACDRPAPWTEAHHLISWPDGGATSLDNTALLCQRHHVIVHTTDWRIRLNSDDRLPELIPPAYVDPARKPRRNKFHRRT
jgi:hypothetical protein